MRLTGTILSNTYLKDNENQTPEWISNTDFTVEEKKPLDIEFEKKTIADEMVKVNRDTRDYMPKPVTAKLNDNEIMLSKIELSKFLGRKHYNIKEASKNSTNVVLHTAISNIPGVFDFIYDIRNNHIIQAQSFKYNDSLYPFNKAGFEECLEDIKKSKKTAQKVETDKASIFTSEEVYRRYNGHIRQATDRINELLQEGSIIGVGSNKFGTYYDVDYLFPQQEKQAIEQGKQFEFVKNLEKVAATPHKSAYQLAMEASKMFNAFDDFKIIDYKRNNDTLTVQAKVLKNNVSKLQVFDFDIKDEKVSYKDLTASFEGSNYLNKQNNRLSEQNVINKNTVINTLKQNGYIEANIDKAFDELKANNVLTQIDSNNYLSNNTTEEILSLTADYIGKQDLQKLAELSDKVEDKRVSKEDVQDTGVRENPEKTLNGYVLEASKQFKHNFDDFKILNSELKHNKLFIKAKVLKNSITKIGTFGFIIKDNKVQSKQFKDVFNNTLQAQNKRFNDKNIISKADVSRQLQKEGYFNYNINQIFSKLLQDNKIAQVAKDTFISNHNVNQLLNYTHTLLGQQNKEKLHKLMKKVNGFNKIEAQDHGVRNIKAYITNETIINAVNKYLTQYFDNFNVVDFTITQGEEYSNVEYNIEVFNNETGLSLNIRLTVIVKDNVVTNCSAIVNGEQFSLNDINSALSISDSLNNYLDTFTNKQVKANIIFTKNEFERKLQRVAHLSNIDDTLTLLKHKEYVTEIGQDKYASKYTLAQLINNSNLKALTKDEINEKIKKAQVNKNTVKADYIQDNDTRDVVDTWTPDECRVYISNQISKYFKNYEILNVQIDKNQYIVTINGTDMDGLNKSIVIYFNTDKGHPSEIVNIIKPTANRDIQEYLNYNEANINNYKGIITQKQLEQQLLNVINVDEFEDILNMLIDDCIIIELDNNNYGLNNTMSEIVGYISNKKKTDITANKNRLKQAVQVVDMRDTVEVKDNDTRTIEYKQSLTLAGKVAQKKLNNKIIQAHKLNKITDNKYKELLSKSDKCVSEAELSNIEQQLNKYL